jgi:hypothetical protein
MGWRTWSLLGLFAGLSGCVAMPASEEPYYDARGLPLVASDGVVGFVATTTQESNDPPYFEYYPIKDVETVVGAFEDGFHKLRSDAKIQWADENMREACFPPGSSDTDPSTGGRVVRPALGAARCQVLVDRLDIRYMISIGGVQTISSRTVSDGSGNVGEVGKRRDHTFALDASVFDVASGRSVCSVSEVSSGKSMEILVISALIVPIPVVKLLDENLFWKDVTFRAGYRIGGCFVQPDEKK